LIKQKAKERTHNFDTSRSKAPQQPNHKQFHKQTVSDKPSEVQKRRAGKTNQEDYERGIVELTMKFRGFRQREKSKRVPCIVP
jgi:hypothetical protein